MTYDETLAIMAVLKAAYPAFYRDMKRKDGENAANLWAEMFKDEPAEIVAVAVKSFIATDVKGFPPNIGVIKEAIAKLRQGDEMTEVEAWNLVRQAINGASVDPSSVRYSGGVTDGKTSALRNFEKLPEILQRLVGSPNQLAEWAQLDPATVASVVASNFQRSYKARAKHEKEFLMLPTDVRQAVEQLSAGLKMPELPGRLPEGEFEQRRAQGLQKLTAGMKLEAIPDRTTKGAD